MSDRVYPFINCLGELVETDLLPGEVAPRHLTFICEHHAKTEMAESFAVCLRNAALKSGAVVEIFVAPGFMPQAARKEVLDILMSYPDRKAWLFTYARRMK